MQGGLHLGVITAMCALLLKYVFLMVIGSLVDVLVCVCVCFLHAGTACAMDENCERDGSEGCVWAE